MIQIKRIYEEPEEQDGYRMLVDRLWPRGVSKEKAHLNEWNREVAPSAELRKWFGHKPENFEEFMVRYAAELQDKSAELARIRQLGQEGNLTLLYAARDPQMNQARVLLSILQKAMNPL